MGSYKYTFSYYVWETVVLLGFLCMKNIHSVSWSTCFRFPGKRVFGSLIL